MDPATHKRFLTYIEMWPYFHEPGTQQLGRQEWLAHDSAYEQLLRDSTASGLDADGVRELRALAKLLNRD